MHFAYKLSLPVPLCSLLTKSRERITQHWRHCGWKRTCHFAASSKHPQKIINDSCLGAMFTSAFLPRSPRGLRASAPGPPEPPGGPMDTSAVCQRASRPGRNSRSDRCTGRRECISLADMPLRTQAAPCGPQRWLK